MPLKRDKPETKLQRQIVDALEKGMGLEVIRLQSGVVRARRGYIHGCKAGTPDILTIVGGRALFFEVKLPGEKPTKVQKERHDELRRRAGALVWTVSSVDEAVRIVTSVRNAVP